MPESQLHPREEHPGSRGPECRFPPNLRSCLIATLVFLAILFLLGVAAQLWSRRCEPPRRDEFRDNVWNDLQQMDQVRRISRPPADRMKASRKRLARGRSSSSASERWCLDSERPATRPPCPQRFDFALIG